MKFTDLRIYLPETITSLSDPKRMSSLSVNDKTSRAGWHSSLCLNCQNDVTTDPVFLPRNLIENFARLRATNCSGSYIWICSRCSSYIWICSRCSNYIWICSRRYALSFGCLGTPADLSAFVPRIYVPSFGDLGTAVDFSNICSPYICVVFQQFRHSSGFSKICSPYITLIYGEQLTETCLLYLIASLQQNSLEYIHGKSVSCT